MQRDEQLAINCLQIIRKFSWLLDAFVLDFYVENHWTRLPHSWQNTLADVELDELGQWLSMQDKTLKRVWPLSLLALRVATSINSLPREPSVKSGDESQSKEQVIYEQPEDTTSQVPLVTKCLTNVNLTNLFMKHVKPKKRHETATIASICARVARETGCKFLVDVGAGKGHLSRLLGYGYSLHVCCLEAQGDLITAARKLDLELEYTASKHLGETYVKSLPRPKHLQVTLDSKVSTLHRFELDIREAFEVGQEEDFSFGIVGLHPCGDLAATLLRIFALSKNSKFICIAGCCYMKLTTCNAEKEIIGYPLSSFYKALPNDFVRQSYEALEVSCHALENYSLRLQDQRAELLKIHSYRAVLETIILKYWPDKRRIGLHSVKHYNKMSFAEYAEAALQHANLKVPVKDLTCEETDLLLQRWKHVVVLYSLRLLLAPLVETAVLLDRVMFVREQGATCRVIPAFDPHLSPRNLLLQGCKNETEV